MRKSTISVASLALVLCVSLAGAAGGQPAPASAPSAEVECVSNRSFVQDDPTRRQTQVRVGENAEREPRLATVQQVARIVLYDPADHSGARVGITRDIPDLASRRFANVASSIRVYGGAWQLCDEANYGGTCRCFASHTNLNRFGVGNPVADVNLEAEGFADTVASLRLIRR